MEPFSFIINAIAAAALSAVPAPAATVPGTIDLVNVSNTSVITQSAAATPEAKTATDAKVAAAKDDQAQAAKTEADKAAEAAKAETAKTAEKEKLQLPLKAGTYAYTSDYGLRCAPVTGAGNFHYGIDLAAPTGTPIYSISDGTVTDVVDGVVGGVGGNIQIESTINGKLMTLRYHHMGNSSQYVKVGDKVTAGQHISDVNTTGMSTGAHLHLEVFEGKFSEWKHLDPEQYFNSIGLPIISSASANVVNKDDHPASCPGGYDTSTGPLVAAGVVTQPSPSPSATPAPAQPAAPASPAAPAPAAPAAPATPATPAAPAAPVTPTPTPTAVPTTPAPTPSALPTPTASPTSTAIVVPSPVVSVSVTPTPTPTS